MERPMGFKMNGTRWCDGHKVHPINKSGTCAKEGVSEHIWAVHQACYNGLRSLIQWTNDQIVIVGLESNEQLQSKPLFINKSQPSINDRAVSIKSDDSRNGASSEPFIAMGASSNGWNQLSFLLKSFFATEERFAIKSKILIVYNSKSRPVCSRAL